MLAKIILRNLGDGDCAGATKPLQPDNLYSDIIEKTAYPFVGYTLIRRNDRNLVGFESSLA